MPTILRIGGCLSNLSLRPNPHIACMHGGQIENIQSAIVATAPHNSIVKWIRLSIATLASANPMPGTKRNAAATEVTAWSAVAPCILPVAVNIVWYAVIYRYVIHLCNGQVDILPGLSFVERHVQAAIVSAHNPLAIFRIEPHVVVIAPGCPLVKIFHKSLS